MANIFTVETMKDTTEHAVVKLTGKFDGSGQENSNGRLAAWAFSGALNANTVPGLLSSGGEKLPYYGLGINRIWYDCASDGEVELFWMADIPRTIMFLNGNGDYNATSNWITIPNSAKGSANCKGDIGINTRGMTPDSSYTIIIELRKDNAHFQRGQFNDPAAFNYGEYSIIP